MMIGINGVLQMGHLTQRERIMRYAQDRYGTEPEYLWRKYPNYAIFRHPASKKWFAAIMDIPRRCLELDGDELVDVMDVKCGPVLVGSLLAQDGYFPAYHMSKSSWVSVILDDTVPDEDIYPLLELSYDSVAPKRKRT